MKTNGEPRIGVYICHCGTNIAGVVNIQEVVEFVSKLPGVVVAKDYRFVCSDPGQDMIKHDIKDHNLTRVVVAACSPTLHELTFRKACESVGLNPFLFQMANIREQCSWVTEDPKEATEKAKDLIVAAVKRAYLHNPIQIRRVPIKPAVLIVGGGIAGIEAALEIADAGKKVYLVEREPSIGGKMAMLDKTFPTLDCSSCILTPKMSAVGRHENITLLTYSEIEEVSGYVGNFKIKIRKKARCVDEKLCNGCGICWEKCPWKKKPSEFDRGLGTRPAIYIPFPQAVPLVPVIDKEYCVYYKRKGACRLCEKECPAEAIRFEQEDEIIEVEVGTIIVATGYKLFDCSKMPQYGYRKLPNVIDSLQFERLSSPSGPTGGKIKLADGREPESIAILHCIGSRDENFNRYCSRVCCMYAMKFAYLVKEKLPDAKVYNLYIDVRAYGKGFEEFYRRVMDEGVTFLRGKGAEVTDIWETEEEKGKLIVKFEDTLLGYVRRLPVDMVVLCAALEPQDDAQDIARKFGLECSMDNFFLERHPKLAPVQTMNEGVLIAGACQGPKDIPDTVAQAGMAASAALSLIDKGQAELDPYVVDVDEELCSGCRVCIVVCPYDARKFDEEKGIAKVDDTLCKGCGACASACPSGATKQKFFEDEKILAEIEGILQGGVP